MKGEKSPVIELTSEQIIEILTTRVRCLTLEQIARTAYPRAKNPLTAARQWLGRMGRANFVTLQTFPVHPELSLTAPLLDYHTGDPAPNFDAISWSAQSRWKEPPVMSLVVKATNEALKRTGGSLKQRPLRLREVTHDLHVASVYLRLLENNPELAAHWIHEDAMGDSQPETCGSARPDAVLDGPEKIIVEFAGSYSAKKLRALAADYAAQGRFQFW